MYLISIRKSSFPHSGLWYLRYLVLVAERRKGAQQRGRNSDKGVLSPRCVGAAARRAGLSPLHCEAPLYCWPVCFLQHTFPPIGSLALGGFFPSSCGWIFPAVPIFEIQGLNRLTSVSRTDREDLRSKKFTIRFLWTASSDSAAQTKNFQVYDSKF